MLADYLGREIGRMGSRTLPGKLVHCIDKVVAVDLPSVCTRQRFSSSLADKDVMTNVEMRLDGILIKMPVGR
jgi:hypothetical protein